jgi:hypothetical protein
VSKKEHPQARLWGHPDTVDVFENPVTALWLREKARAEAAAFARLAGDNRERFARVWGGAPARAQDGSLVWVLAEGGCPLFCASSAEGSFYKIHYVGGKAAYAADRRLGSQMSAFFERLLTELRGAGPWR